MKIGDFRHRIKFIKEEIGENDLGDPIKIRSEYANVWAKVTNLHGREYIAAAAVHLERTLLFTIRYKEGLDETMWIEFQGATYDIHFIDNIKYGDRYMEIRAMFRGR